MPLTWREAFTLVSPDLPKEELRKRIDEVECAIFTRFQELRNAVERDAELSEMVDVMQTIRRLQAEKLGFPDFVSDAESSPEEPAHARRRVRQTSP